jgi:hypothetical protein
LKEVVRIGMRWEIDLIEQLCFNGSAREKEEKGRISREEKVLGLDRLQNTRTRKKVTISLCC